MVWRYSDRFRCRAGSPAWHCGGSVAGEPISLRCKYYVNPLGMDVEKPRLSWVLQSDMRGQKQTAYRILVEKSETKFTHHRSRRPVGQRQSPLR